MKQAATYVCQNCGETYKNIPAVPTPKYCSKVCFAQARIKAPSKEKENDKRLQKHG
jgi:hypothetical protein